MPYDGNIFYEASGDMFEHARVQRREPTPAEKRLWAVVRNGQILGCKIRRQHPVSSFLVNFYCHDALLVIEVDGSIHEKEDVKERDVSRTYELEKLGLSVIRFSNDAVFNDLGWCS